MQNTYRHYSLMPLNRDAYPWPSYEEIMNQARQMFLFSLRPARPFPAANFCPLSAKPKRKFTPLRISTEQLPTLTISAWREEFEQNFAFTLSPWPARKRTPRQRGKLERWLDAHRGALRIWKRKPAQPAAPESPYLLDNLAFPFPHAEGRRFNRVCDQCHEPIDGPEWEANEHSKVLCGKCWLEQESWAR